MLETTYIYIRSLRSTSIIRSFEVLFAIFSDRNEKKTDYLEWDEYFMALAFLAAKRSKDPCTQVGACIVDTDKRIVSLGYNGMPKGCSDDEFPWGKNTASKMDSKFLYGT